MTSQAHPATRDRLKRRFLTSNPPSCYTLTRLWVEGSLTEGWPSGLWRRS